MRPFSDAVNEWGSLDACASLQDLHAKARTLDDGSGPISRSLVWKTSLVLQTLDRSRWAQPLETTRASYETNKQIYLRPLQNPDEVDAFADPLSEGTDSPWDSLRKDELLRQEVLRDVERCMPENLYFQQPETQNILLDTLFTWAKLNPDVSYRQGMHELAAPVLWVVERDAVDPSSQNTPNGSGRDALIACMFDSDYIEHDTFTIFNAIMEVNKPAFEHNEVEKQRRQSNQSMVERCRCIVDVHVARADPPLTEHLNSIGIVPQTFLLRWIRLLFGREMDFDTMLHFWDSLFATNFSSQMIDLICVAMLLRIRWQLLESDYNSAIQLLFKYPQPAATRDVLSMIDDAVRLKASPTPAGGREVIIRRTGRTPPLVDRPGTPISTNDRHDGQTHPGTASPSRRAIRIPQLPTGLESRLENAARGIYNRGERWGLNQAVRDVVVEVRKNVQNVQSRPHSRLQSRSETPRRDLRSAPLGSVQARLEGLETRNKALAKMLDGTVSTLWENQREGTAGSSSAEGKVDAVTTAIAKVQFVQVYLADSSLALPVELDSSEHTESEDMASSGTAEPNAEPREDISNPPSPAKGFSAAGAPTDKVKPQQDTSATSKSRSRVLTASQLLDQAHPTASIATPNPTPTRTPQSSTTTPKPQPKPSRPSLEQSSFSWMLGQDSSSPSSSSSSSPKPSTSAGTSARKAFISAAPFKEGSYRGKPSEARRSNAYLFGDEEDDPFARRGSASKGGLKRGEEEEERPVLLGTLRGSPRK